MKLGDDIEMQVSGEGTVAFKTSQGQVNLLRTKFIMFLTLHIIY